MPISDKIRLIVYRRDNYQCTRPGCKSSKNLTLDHVIPKSKGGSDAIENLTTMCEPCNKEKGNYAPTLKEKIFSFIFTKREANTLRNDLIHQMKMEDGLVKRTLTDEFNVFLEEDGRKTKAHITETLSSHNAGTINRVNQLLSDFKKSIDIKLVGLENRFAATSPPSVSDDKCERLLNIVYLLADRVEALEKYHNIQFIDENIKRYISM